MILLLNGADITSVFYSLAWERDSIALVRCAAQGRPGQSVALAAIHTLEPFQKVTLTVQGNETVSLGAQVIGFARSARAAEIKLQFDDEPPKVEKRVGALRELGQ